MCGNDYFNNNKTEQYLANNLCNKQSNLRKSFLALEKKKVLNNIANAKIIRNHYALKYHEQQFLKIIQQAEFFHLA